MKKAMFTVLFLLVVCMMAQAQSSRFGAALVAGGNVSQILGDRVGGYNKIGLVAGVKSIIDVGYKMEVEVELLYEQRGSRSDLIAGRVNDPWTFGLNYVSVPVLFTYKDWWDEDEKIFRIGASAGLVYGRLFQVVNDGALVSDERIEALQANDLSFTLGPTYYWSRNWGVTARFTRTIFSLTEGGSPFGDFCNGLNTCKIYPFQISFRLEYKF